MHKFMLRHHLKEILEKKGISNYWLWKHLGINQGQLSGFFNGKKNISLNRLERIIDQLGYKIVFLSKKETEKEQQNKKRVNLKKAVTLTEREIEGSIEKFEFMCPGYYVEAIDGPPVKLRLRRGATGVVSTKAQNEPDWKQRSEKPRRFRHFPIRRDLT